MAASEGRRLEVADLWWGCWAVRASQGALPSSLSEETRQTLTELSGKRVDAKVGVASSVTDLDGEVRRDCSGRQATLDDVVRHLVACRDPEVQRLVSDWGLNAGPTDPPGKPVPDRALEVLRGFTLDLTDQAARGRLTPAYERERERQILVQIQAPRRPGRSSPS